MYICNLCHSALKLHTQWKSFLAEVEDMLIPHRICRKDQYHIVFKPYSAVNFLKIPSQQAPHSSPVRVRYGVSVVSSKSDDPWAMFVTASLYSILCHIFTTLQQHTTVSSSQIFLPNKVCLLNTTFPWSMLTSKIVYLSRVFFAGSFTCCLYPIYMTREICLHSACRCLGTYCQTSNISYTKSQNLDVSRLVLHLSLLNPLRPDVMLRMKM